MPTKALVNIQGNFPAGCTLQVWICNNGNDASPTWEDITQKVRSGQKHYFTNKATITAIAAGKAHPYHLKAVSGGGSTVYGWVNAADISTGSAGTATSYRVRTTADVLNIRKGPGTNYGVAGQIKGKGIYTIVAEAAGPGATKWGKLKSGAGWISLDYVTKL